MSSIQETEARFWHDFHGGVSAGANYAKSNNQSQYNLNANLNYIKRVWLASSQLQSSFSGSVSSPSDLHNDISTYALRTISATNYVVIALSDFLRSDEQQLALMAVLGGGAGKILKTTEASRIVLVGGSVWIHQRYQTSGTPTLNNANAMGGLILDYFRFKTTSLSTVVFAYQA